MSIITTVHSPGMMAIRPKYRGILDSLRIPCVADSDQDSADSLDCGFGFFITRGFQGFRFFPIKYHEIERNLLSFLQLVP